MTDQQLIDHFKQKVVNLHEQVVGLLQEVQNVTKVVTIDDVYKELKKLNVPHVEPDPLNDEDIIAVLLILFCLLSFCIIYVSSMFRKSQCHCKTGIRIL
jgi:hypothetical protein